MTSYLRVLVSALRALTADKKGLETLEYTVFAVAFVVVISGVVAALSTQETAAYHSIGNWMAGQAKQM